MRDSDANQNAIRKPPWRQGKRHVEQVLACADLLQNCTNRLFFSYFIYFYYCSFLIFCFLLRVEYLLKTDSGCPKDTRVTLFTLAAPGNPLHYCTHRSPPPVSALAHCRGPRKRSQSPVRQEAPAGESIRDVNVRRGRMGMSTHARALGSSPGYKLLC